MSLNNTPVFGSEVVTFVNERKVVADFESPHFDK